MNESAVVKALVNNYVVHMRQMIWPAFALTVCERCGLATKKYRVSYQWTGTIPGGELVILCYDCLFDAIEDYRDWRVMQ